MVSPSLLNPLYRATSMQFSFGAGVRSGSSWHYHASSVTLLLQGVKEWCFLPPGHGRLSNVVGGSLECDGGGSSGGNSSGGDSGGSGDGGGGSCCCGSSLEEDTCHRELITFVQYPGDVVVVPDRWSHKTVNRANNTMGVTFEIALKQHPRPMEPYHVDYVKL